MQHLGRRVGGKRTPQAQSVQKAARACLKTGRYRHEILWMA